MASKSIPLPEKIDRLFGRAGRPLSFEEIRFQIPIRSDEIRKCLDSLVRSGRVAEESREERFWATGSRVVTRTYYTLVVAGKEVASG